jgi:hypothetical protein
LEVDVQQGNFKILRLLPQVLILFLVEKWIPPSRSETAKIGQKTEGILGVKLSYKLYVKRFKIHYMVIHFFYAFRSCYEKNTPTLTLSRTYCAQVTYQITPSFLDDSSHFPVFYNLLKSFKSHKLAPWAFQSLIPKGLRCFLQKTLQNGRF